MKTYIVYVRGEEVGKIKAFGHNDAEERAQKQYLSHLSADAQKTPAFFISVAYTEV